MSLGVDLRYSHASPTGPKPWNAEEVPPNTVQLRGPCDAVDELMGVLQKYESVLDRCQKHVAQWSFGDDAWAALLWRRQRRRFEVVLTREAEKLMAWWDVTVPAETGTVAAEGPSAQASGVESAPTVSIASAEIAGVALEVAYAQDIVRSTADALILSCGPTMAVEDGLPKEAADLYASLRPQAEAARKAKFGAGPLPECEFVPIEVPPGRPTAGAPSLVICSHVPAAAAGDEVMNRAKLREAVRGVLRYVAERNRAHGSGSVATVAMPLLGAARFGHDPRAAAEAVAGEVLCQAPSSRIERVRFLDRRVEALEALRSELERKAGALGAPCTASELPVKEVHVPAWYYYVARVEGGSSRNHDAAMKGAGAARHWIPDAKGTWFALFPDVQERVEEAYQEYLEASACAPGAPPPAAVTFSMDHPSSHARVEYEIRFDCSPMRQRNTRTGFERRVFRKHSSYCCRKPDLEAIGKILAGRARPAIPEPPAGGKEEAPGISFLALDRASAESACRAARSEVARRFGVRSERIPMPPGALLDEESGRLWIRSSLDGLHLAARIEMGPGEPPAVCLTGLPEELALGKERLVRSLPCHAGTEGGAPATWASTGPDRNAVVDVGVGTAEYHDVAAKFMRGLPSASMRRVQRVENAQLYRAYRDSLGAWLKRYPVDIGPPLGTDGPTKELWHGTLGLAPERVALAPDGVGSCQESSNAPCGRSVYFSSTSGFVEACGSAYRLPGSGLRQMVLFEVITGLECEVDEISSWDEPPPVPADHPIRAVLGSSAPPNLSYDSVTGMIHGARIYAVCPKGRAKEYPLYIVTYDVGSG